MPPNLVGSSGPNSSAHQRDSSESFECDELAERRLGRPIVRRERTIGLELVGGLTSREQQVLLASRIAGQRCRRRSGTRLREREQHDARSRAIDSVDGVYVLTDLIPDALQQCIAVRRDRRAMHQQSARLRHHHEFVVTMEDRHWPGRDGRFWVGRSGNFGHADKIPPADVEKRVHRRLPLGLPNPYRSAREIRSARFGASGADNEADLQTSTGCGSFGRFLRVWLKSS